MFPVFRCCRIVCTSSLDNILPKTTGKDLELFILEFETEQNESNAMPQLRITNKKLKERNWVAWDSNPEQIG